MIELIAFLFGAAIVYYLIQIKQHLIFLVSCYKKTDEKNQKAERKMIYHEFQATQKSNVIVRNDEVLAQEEESRREKQDYKPKKFEEI